MNVAIISGSAGLIGSQACDFFHKKGFKIVGLDNDLRAYFFGAAASTRESLQSLQSNLTGYEHHNVDVRDYQKLSALFSDYSSDIRIVIHTAAQPSHDWAAREPLTDFGVNAGGTMHLLECTRQYCPQATFVFTSTNKVYGDRPNRSYEQGRPDPQYHGLMISEEETRWEARWADHTLAAIDETMSIDHCTHSVFGASKVAADVMCQEYGKYFGMKVGVFRGGCLTGPNHAGTELHGFLSYLVKRAVQDKPYTIFGYKGKQVRDNIHSWDLVNMFWHFHQHPRPGEVYNAGGGRNNSTSILEAIDRINRCTGRTWHNYTLSDQRRIGDHIWYISNLSKFKTHYPEWDLTIGLEETLQQMVASEQNKL